MYFLSVGALFKNEEHAIVEWIEHYLFRGVEHFYLIDDRSTDSSVEKLQPYIKKGLITLFTSNHPYYLGRQRNMYNEYFTPHIKETEWLLIVDLDEFVWSPASVSFVPLLRDLFNENSQLQAISLQFYSNGHIKQPKSIVEGFTKRDSTKFRMLENGQANLPVKYFIHTTYDFSSLNVHHADHVLEEIKLTRFKIVNTHVFQLNHYICQSREFWNTVKCTRGDSDDYRNRTPEEFDEIHKSIDEVEDYGLLEQNRSLLQKLGLLESTTETVTKSTTE
jgi:hypothetical protein